MATKMPADPTECPETMQAERLYFLRKTEQILTHKIQKVGQEIYFTPKIVFLGIAEIWAQHGHKNACRPYK